jgi:gas vesicle protein
MNSNQALIEEPINGDRSSTQDNYNTPNGNGLTRIAIGALIGAALGSIAAALTHQETTERVNQTIRGLGSTVKATANNLNDSVQRVSTAINSVASNVNDTTQDVSQTVNSVATDVSSAIRSTVSTVRQTTAEVTEKVKTTKDAVKTVQESVSDPQEPEPPTITIPGDLPEMPSENTLYKLVPVHQDSLAK